MKCTKIQRIILERDPAELSVEVTSHLEACPDCGRHYRRGCMCRDLVGLKRYERPSDLRREACLAELHDRLTALHHQTDPGGWELHPAFRYGIAAAILVMAGAHFAVITGAPVLHSPVTRSDLRSRTYEQFLADQQSLFPGRNDPAQLFRTYPTVPALPNNTLPPAARTKSIFYTEYEPGP